jgi:hypothetical protein
MANLMPSFTEIDTSATTPKKAAPARAERPCGNCSALNQVGAPSCYHCRCPLAVESRACARRAPGPRDVAAPPKSSKKAKASKKATRRR